MKIFELDECLAPAPSD